MARYSTILTVFEQTEAELAALETSIKPNTVLLRRIDNAFFIQMASNAKFWVVAEDLEAQDIKFVYYFVKINDRADLWYNGIDDDETKEIKTILTTS